MTETRELQPHELPHHPHYPDGFPDPADRSLFGEYDGNAGKIVVAKHPHGYEVHVFPCMMCSACTVGEYRSCPERGGPIFTVAGDHPEAVLFYLYEWGNEHGSRLWLLHVAHEEALDVERLRASHVDQIAVLEDEQPEGYEHTVEHLRGLVADLLR